MLYKLPYVLASINLLEYWHASLSTLRQLEKDLVALCKSLKTGYYVEYKLTDKGNLWQRSKKTDTGIARKKE